MRRKQGKVNNFDEAYERILLVTGCRTQIELAEMLGIRQSSISDAKRRESIPSEWLLTIFERFGVLHTWILTGVGPRYITEGSAWAKNLPGAANYLVRESVRAALEKNLSSIVDDICEKIQDRTADEGKDEQGEEK